MVRAIPNNDSHPAGDSSVNHRREFTASEATEMLPLVRRIVADMVEVSRSIESQREQLRGIDSIGETIEDPAYQEELSDVRSTLAEDEKRLAACMGELTALGLSAHLPIDGSVDFPAVLNRRSVCLCWRPGDDEVLYWHESDQPNDQPSGRRKIDLN